MNGGDNDTVAEMLAPISAAVPLTAGDRAAIDTALRQARFVDARYPAHSRQRIDDGSAIDGRSGTNWSGESGSIFTSS
ncbi:TPA: hypothetical protein ACU9T0_002694 [Burkholderia cenocepacia]